MICYDITDADRALIDTAMAALERSYDGHYHVVGAALRCQNGRVYAGVNCDGIHGSCAEFTAMGAAVAAGEKAFDTIVAVHKNAPNHVVAPCGNCRQMLFEYGPDIRVLVNDDEGKLVKVCVRDLLPFAYVEIPLQDGM